GGYEALALAAGGVAIPERTLEALAEARGAAPEAMCLNAACHANADGSAMTRSDLAALTADEYGARNPHVDQHGNAECSDCHKAHRQSVNYCSGCHADALVPDGWLSSAEAKKLEEASFGSVGE
ncbi:MAG: cytochrome c3 family protein, partial [Eggerthellaceae bacterium]|nr:cytochrome c3 family protein [Eggerthellaceae bacterium]